MPLQDFEALVVELFYSGVYNILLFYFFYSGVYDILLFYFFYYSTTRCSTEKPDLKKHFQRKWSNN